MGDIQGCTAELAAVNAGVALNVDPMSGTGNVYGFGAGADIDRACGHTTGGQWAASATDATSIPTAVRYVTADHGPEFIGLFTVPTNFALDQLRKFSG
ncbi:MAG: hypothetical protein AB7Q97_12690 [Gammaproteobacteria bacterium]